MTPIDIRNETWESIQGRLQAERQKVYFALLDAGETTTRDLAARMGWERDNVRPRVTELLQMGFVDLVRKDAAGGVYRALTFAQARARFDERKKAGDQMLMAI
jgi:predicted transcriptional regulator